MTNATEPLNSGLFRLHRIFYVVYAVATLGFLITAIVSLNSGEDLLGVVGVPLIFAPFFALHWFASKGAKMGKSYGRTLSIIAGVIWLIGVPIGTIIGIYALSQTGSKWKAEGSSAVPSEA